MKLTIIILNYNVRHFLELCIKSVEAAIQNIEAEIIVVDNDSPDDSCKMVTELFPSVRLIENKENSGFSKGNNIGVALAKGEYLCILNPDTVVAEDTFLRLLGFAESKENLGIVGCQLIDGKGKFLPESKRNIPSPKIALKKILGNDKHYYVNDLDNKSTGKADVLVGAFMFLKKEVYNTVGGFDEDYFMYGEDIDLSYKVLKSGYNNYYFGETTVIHFKGESTLKDSKYAMRFYGAMQIFYKKHFKHNIIFNAIVWFGIKLAQSFRKPTEKVEPKTYRTYLYSKQNNLSLIHKLNNIAQVSDTIKVRIEDFSMLVYDFNDFKAKDTINDMKEKSKQENIVFRFISKNSKFIIGSDSSTGRGQVIRF